MWVRERGRPRVVVDPRMESRQSIGASMKLQIVFSVNLTHHFYPLPGRVDRPSLRTLQLFAFGRIG